MDATITNTVLPACKAHTNIMIVSTLIFVGLSLCILSSLICQAGTCNTHNMDGCFFGIPILAIVVPCSPVMVSLKIFGLSASNLLGWFIRLPPLTSEMFADSCLISACTNSLFTEEISG